MATDDSLGIYDAFNIVHRLRQKQPSCKSRGLYKAQVQRLYFYVEIHASVSTGFRCTRPGVKRRQEIENRFLVSDLARPAPSPAKRSEKQRITKWIQAYYVPLRKRVC